MNTSNLPTPKTIELSRKGWAVLLPSGDFSLHQSGVGMYIYAEDFAKIIGGMAQTIAPEPLQFPELPEGEEWLNGRGLKPSEVEIQDGWRMLLKSEMASPPLEVEVWDSPTWRSRYQAPGHSLYKEDTYRTKAPLPTQKEKEEPKVSFDSMSQAVKVGESIFPIAGDVMETIGKRAMAKFLRSCRVIVLQNPMDEPDPFGTPGALVTLLWGKKEGFGEVNPDGEFESYLDGKTFKIRNIVSIVP